MELSEFIDAYLDTGKSVLEEAKNLNGFMGMFKGLQKFPDVVQNGTEEPPAKFLKTSGDDGTQATYYDNGNIAYRGTGGKAPRFNFDQTPPEAPSFTPEEWEQLKVMFANKDEEGNNLEQDDEKLSALQLKKKIQKENNAVADAAAQRTVEALGSVGFSDNGAMKNMFRQLCGGGTAGALQRAARAKSDEALQVAYAGDKKLKGVESTLTDEEGTEKAREQAASCAEDIAHLEKTVQKLVDIKRKLNNDGKGLTESDRKFLTDCFRLRGQRGSAKKGIYMVPDDATGEFCGGPLAAAAIEYQDGGERYGVQINNQKGPLYAMMVQIHDDSLKKNNPLYGENGLDSKGKPKPAVFWGGTNAAKGNAYRAMMGVMNEYGPKLSKAWMECNYQQPCDELQAQLKKMVAEENFNLNLLIWGAEERSGGTVPQSQFANIEEIGTDLILDQMEEELGGEIDGAKALAWFTANMLNMWDPLVSDPQFKNCDFEVVGRGPTGQQPNGGKVTQDIEVNCSGKEKTHLEAFADQGGKFNVGSGEGSYGSDEDKNREHYEAEKRPGTVGVNVKVSQGGDSIQMGKIGAAVVDSVETDKKGNIIGGFTPDTKSARNRALNYIETVAKNLGVPFTPEQAQAAEDYKLAEVKFSHDTMAALDGLEAGTIGQVITGEMAKMGYDDANAFGELNKHIGEYENAPEGSIEKEKARKRLETTLTQAYRNKHKDSPGFRTNLAIEMMQAGSASQNQLLVITDPGGDTYIGTEADAVNRQIIEEVLGYGNPEGPAEIAVTGTSTKLSTGQELTRRVKDNSKVQEVRYPSKKTKKNMKNMSGGRTARGVNPQVKESAMKAEDFVRQLQELIKRIDKVQTV